MNNNLLLGLLTAGLAASVIGVGTYAYFSDIETSVGNSMYAGVLDLKVYNYTEGFTWNDGTAPFVTITDMKPSYDKWSDMIGLKMFDNPAKVWMRLVDFECTGGEYPEPEQEVESAEAEGTVNSASNWLPAVSDFKYKVDFVGPVESELYTPLSDYIGHWFYIGVVQPGDDGRIGIWQYFYLVDTAGNEYQGDACTFDVQFLAQQINAPAPEDTVFCMDISELDLSKKTTTFPESDFFEVSDGRYITKQLHAGESALQLEAEYAPSIGDVIMYDVDYISGSGNHMSRIVVNGEYLDENCWEVWNDTGCGAIGYWNGVHGFGDELGTYHVKVTLLESRAVAEVTTPSNEVAEASMDITGLASFGVESHSGHDGLFQFDYYNFEVDRCSG